MLFFVCVRSCVVVACVPFVCAWVWFVRCRFVLCVVVLEVCDVVCFVCCFVI